MFVRTMRGEHVALAAVERLGAEARPAEDGRPKDGTVEGLGPSPARGVLPITAGEDCSFAELRTSVKVS